MARNMRSGRPTLMQVAGRAGVSQGTVSKVLNGRSDVSEATRSRVLGVVEELGYRARAPRRIGGAQRSVTALFERVSTQYASLVLEGMVEAASENGAEVVVRLTPPDFEADGAASRWFRSHAESAGVVAVTSTLPVDAVRTAAALGLPLVSIDPVGEPQPELVGVGTTNLAGGRMMTAHLVGLGHTRIGWVGGRTTSAPTVERFRGYRMALDHAGIAYRDDLVVYHDYDFDSGVAAGRELLDRPDRPTAIVCANDAIAFGVVQSARMLGLDVPRDVSIGGFDDIPQAAWVSPGLTSVRAPLVGIGRLAMETALGMADGKEPVSHHIELASRLIVRESTTAPPSTDR